MTIGGDSTIKFVRLTMKSAWQLLAKLSLLLACSVLGSVAQAGNIGGSWDPQFNSTYSGTGFRGNITFFVPDLCLIGTPSTTKFINDSTDACSLGGMSLVSAQVDLYDWLNPSSILSTITFAPPVQSPDPIFGLLVQYSATGVGKVIGLDTNPIGPRFSGVASTIAPSVLFLEFASGFLEGPAGGAYLVGGNCTSFEPLTCTPSTAARDRSNAGAVTFTTPEPASLALLLGGLGAGWLARRRKAAA